ncbi:TetR family transcriptional regulator C-terminal domain-containing protein [Streptomyces sp. SID3343]|uniref:TetR family transcriptional regulator C-terminal domain-containing protein n=1 Tax=Streptomyces sp. SID3343 TaxID=2690260 RepID=UPI001371DD5D|nr:TetR family transcriptional regulator C-terminal domain-containing protein [Streptomyces sp. SID3343]MYW03638.1 transcriptional regulator [Streptomyces sp. SID3343]
MPNTRNARDGIAAAAFRVVATGVGDATPADVAAAAGVDVADVGLGDRDDVLLAALEWSHKRIARRFFGGTAGLFGLTALRAAAVDLLPLDDERIAETMVELAVWHRSLLSPRVAAINRRERDDLGVLVRGILQDANDNGELIVGVDVPDAAARLVAVIDGLSLHVLLYPETTSGAAAELAVTEEIDRIDRVARGH